MKYIKLFILLVFTTFYSFSQKEVVISTKKINEHGITFYLHTVQKGETLYRISMAYKVKIDDILYFNPELFNSLKVGQIIKIPEIRENEKYYYHLVKKNETIYSICKKYGITANKLYEANHELKQQGLKEATIIKIPKSHIETNKNNKQDTNEQNFIYHTVKPKETLYSLSKKYNVSINEILNANPFIKDQGLKKYDTIKIPVTKKTNAQTANSYHIVTQGETVYSISKKYNTTVEKLIELNPFLNSNSIKEGDKILVPTKEKLNKPIKQVSDTIKPIKLRFSDSLIMSIDTIFNQCKTKQIKVNYIKILLALPFSRTKIINNPKKDYTNIKNYKKYPILEFYEGFLIAMDSLKNKGLNITLEVVDISDTIKLASIIPTTNLIFIYGDHIYEKNIIKNASKYNIPVINVFKANLFKYNNYVKLLCSKEELKGAIIKLFSEIDTANIIFMHPQNDSSAIKFLSQLQKIADTKPYISLTTTKLDEKEIKNIKNYTNTIKHNYLIMWSFNEPEVTKHISKLALKVSKDKISNLSLILLPEWKQFKYDYEYLHRLNAIKISQTFINYDTTFIYDFQKKYKTLYKNIPTEYAFWGFDVGFYFTSAFSYFSTNLLKCLSSYSIPLFSTEFKISNNAPYKNNAFFIIQFTKDFNQKIKNKL